MKKKYTAYFLTLALYFLPGFSWSSDAPSCTEAIGMALDKAPISRVIQAMKTGARDGDTVCAAYVGSLLSDRERGRKENYSTDIREGYRYLKQAALDSELENVGGLKADAFYWLGRAYFDGKPVLQNYKIAYAWFSLAAALDHTPSSKMRNRTFFLLQQAGLADGVQVFALRCKSSPKLCLPE
jgi:hypothetical protein|tara:strand:- start:151 stop:699 length:549 start_codon:yes stop_codon:yes gene_type:complete